MTETAFVPVHVAIIMDGNGRWAVERGLPRFAGHHRGAERVKEISRAALDSGVSVLTLFAFSTENWNRPRREIDMLVRYLNQFLERERRDMRKTGIRLRVIGRRTQLPKSTIDRIVSIEKETENNSKLTLVLAIDYGSRQEITDAVRRLCADVAAGKRGETDIDEETFGSYLYTSGLPDPDFLIRTSGEQRLSNFLLWQCSYAEFYFAKKFWPDFGAADFAKALAEFRKRKRRFGAAG